MLTLYHNPVSTCSQKVRLVLAEKQLSFDGHVIDWGKQDHLTGWYLQINPNGVVPTLVDDGQAVIDSSVICEYLDEICPQPPLVPSTPYARATMRAWMRYFEEVPTVAIRVPSFNMVFARYLKAMPVSDFDSMTEKMPLRKHFYRQMGAKGFSEQTYQESLDKLGACLARVNIALQDGRPFLLGDYSLADTVLTPTVVRMEDLGLSHIWAGLPRVSDWYDRIKARPAFDIAYFPGSRLDPANYRMGGSA